MNEFKIELKWGLLFSLVTILWMGGEKIIGLHQTYSNLQFLIGIPYFLIFLLGMMDKKRRYYHGKISFKEGIRFGLVLSLIVALLTPIVKYIVFNYVSPDYLPNMIKYMVDNGRMDQASADSFFSLGNQIKSSAYINLVMGVLTSALIALFLKNKLN